MKRSLRSESIKYGLDLLKKENSRESWKFLREASFCSKNSERASVDLNVFATFLKNNCDSSADSTLKLPDGCDDVTCFKFSSVANVEVVHSVQKLNLRTSTGADGFSALLYHLVSVIL